MENDIREGEDDSSSKEASFWTCPHLNKVVTINQHSVARLAFGQSHCIFLTTDHRVFSFGWGGQGQLGLGTLDDHPREPQAVSSLPPDIQDIGCGSNYSAAYTQDGRLFMWGDNSFGQCGKTLDTPTVLVPQQVVFENCAQQCSQCEAPIPYDVCISQLACGHSHILALDSTASELWTWGRQLNGTPSTPHRVTPLNGRRVLSIACGTDYSLAVVETISEVHQDNAKLCPNCKSLESTSSHSSTLNDTICPLGLPLPKDSEASLAKTAESEIMEESSEVNGEQEQSEPSFTKEEQEVLRKIDSSKPAAQRSSSFLDPISAKEFLMRQLSGYNFGLDYIYSSIKCLDGHEKTATLRPEEEPLVEGPKDTCDSNVTYMKDLVRTTFDKFSIASLRQRLSASSSQDESQSSQESFEILELSASNPPTLSRVGRQSRCVLEARQALRLKKLERHESFKSSSMSSSHGGCEGLMEVWSWGKGTCLGHGDTTDREEPTLVKSLSGQRVARVVSGANHALALTWDCRVFSWGRNDHAQLGHSSSSSLVLSPHPVEVPGYVQVWDVVAGNSHTLLLGDLHTSNVAMYYCGQHAECCPGTTALQQLNLLKKSGLVTHVFAGGTYSGCIVDHHHVSVLHEFASSERRYLFQLQSVLDRLLAGLLREGEVEKWWGPLQHLVAVWADLVDLAAMTAYDLTLLVQGGSLSDLSLLHSDWLDTYWEFASALGDLTAVGSLGSSRLLSPALRSLAKDLLGDSLDIQRSNHELLFYLLHIPLRRVGEYVRLLTRLMASLSPQKAQEFEIQQMVNKWRHVSESINKEVQQAELTAKFWSTAPQKLVDALLKPERRLIRDSKTHPLSLASPSKFPLAPAHWFILFNDLLVHYHFGAFETQSLSTIWVESLPDNNTFVLTLPEETLTFNCPSANDKTEWVCVFNQTIRKHLSGGAPRHQDFQSSVPPLSPPLARNATYTYLRHASFRDATYQGMWLCGKMHGYGELTWADGRQFVGKFKSNYQHGEGTLKVPHLTEGFTVYEGTWKEGKLNGFGKVIYHNGDVYEGYFQGGQRHGHGMMKQGQFPAAAAQLYIGEWFNNRRQGYGVLDNIKSGEKYMGMWHEDARHGTGMVVTIDGVYYEGNFYMDKLSGHGVMIFEDNTCFEGELGTGGMFNGKGTLYLSTGDKVEGHFAGVWSEGIKISGTYQKNAGCTPIQTILDSPADPVRSKLSTFGQHCVPADQKWEDLFSHCRATLGILGVDERTDNARAWEAIAVTMTKRRKQPPKRRWHQKNGCDLLERIPQLSGELTAVEYKDIQRYLAAASDCHHHPLGQLVEGLVDVYRAAYLGVGAHPRLLPHAVAEIHSFVNRLYVIVRVLFPSLPRPGTALRRLLSPDHSEEDSSFVYQEQNHLVVSAAGIFHPILLPRLYPPLFTLYALHNEKADEHYWERLLKWNKQSDMALLAFLGVNPKFWPFPPAPPSTSPDLNQNSHKRFSEIKDHCFTKAIDTLQHLSTAFTALEKLKIIHQTFHEINKAVEPNVAANFLWTMDDLFPLFQYVVVRARIRHLGSEIHLVQDLMEPHLENGELGIMFTTLKACYFQIRTEKIHYS